MNIVPVPEVIRDIVSRSSNTKKMIQKLKTDNPGIRIFTPVKITYRDEDELYSLIVDSEVCSPEYCNSTQDAMLGDNYPFVWAEHNYVHTVCDITELV